MGLALLTVLVATPVVLSSLRTCFLVFSCVGFTLVSCKIVLLMMLQHCHYI